MHLEHAQHLSDPWDRVEHILGRIVPPTFPNRDFNVTDYGPVGDGVTDSLPAFREAIAACHEAGGGRVVVPPGRYLLQGPIHLLSNVNLHIQAKATLVFGTNPDDYLVGDPDKGGGVLVRWEGTRCYNYSPLIYAYRQQNIAVTGGGTIDGQASSFWHQWKKIQEPHKQILRRMGAEGTPLEQRVFGRGYHLRPSLFQPYECENVLLQGVTIKESPFWTIHPTFCRNVVIRHVSVEPGTTNDDGCDPDSCRDVLIEHCRIHTADDNIAIKAGRDQDAWGGPACENVIIRHCTLIYSNANGICIGSELSGDVRSVFVENCLIHRARDGALNVKSNPDRGGVIGNFFVRNVVVEDCGNLVKLETTYKDVTDSPYPTQYRNFRFDGLMCHTSRQAGLESIALRAGQIQGVEFRDIQIQNAHQDSVFTGTEGLRIEDVTVNGRAG